MGAIKNIFVLVVMQLILISASAFAMGQKIPKPLVSDPQWSARGVKFEKQEKENWCWVATTRILMSSKFKESNLPSQCQIASKVLGKDCCSFNKSIQCDGTFHLGKAMSALGLQYNEKSPSYMGVVGSVMKGKPVIIVHSNGQGATHASVAYGAYYKNNQYYLLIFDPYTFTSDFITQDYTIGFKEWLVTYELK